jgi:hypothetical protein
MQEELLKGVQPIWLIIDGEDLNSSVFGHG